MQLASNIRFGGAGAYRAAQNQDFPMHRHSVWELVFYREGHIEVPIGEEVFMTRPGLLLLTPPGVPHAERALTAYSNFYITLDAPLEHPWPRAVDDDANGTLSYLFRALLAECTQFVRPQVAAPAEAIMTNLLVAQLDLVLRRQLEAPPVPRAERVVREAERIFEEEFAGTLKIGAVAKAIGVAPSVLRAHFAQQRGYSPIEALFQVRVRQAISRLRSSDLSLKEIAVACGFHSPSHLSRHVKTATGQAPGRWRRVK